LPDIEAIQIYSLSHDGISGSKSNFRQRQRRRQFRRCAHQQQNVYGALREKIWTIAGSKHYLAGIDGSLHFATYAVTGWRERRHFH